MTKDYKQEIEQIYNATDFNTKCTIIASVIEQNSQLTQNYPKEFGEVVFFTLFEELFNRYYVDAVKENLEPEELYNRISRVKKDSNTVKAEFCKLTNTKPQFFTKGIFNFDVYYEFVYFYTITHKYRSTRYPYNYQGKKQDGLIYVLAEICHKHKIKSFADVFGGSGTVTTSLAFVPDRLYNDFDYALVNLMTVLQDEEKYNELLDFMAHIDEYFKKFKIPYYDYRGTTGEKSYSDEYTAEDYKRDSKRNFIFKEKAGVKDILDKIENIEKEIKKGNLTDEERIQKLNELDEYKKEYDNIVDNGGALKYFRYMLQKNKDGNNEIAFFYNDIAPILAYLYHSFDGTYGYESIFNEDSEDYDEIKLAAFFIVMSFFDSVYGSNGFDYSGVNYDTYKNKLNEVLNSGVLDQFAKNLKNVIIRNEDCIDIIKNSNADLLYLDPPYFLTAGYNTPFNDIKHIELINALKEYDKKFILSTKAVGTNKNAKSSLIKDLFTYFQLFGYDYYIYDTMEERTKRQPFKGLEIITEHRNNLDLWVVLFKPTNEIREEILICNFKPDIPVNDIQYSFFLKESKRKSKINREKFYEFGLQDSEYTSLEYKVVKYDDFLEYIKDEPASINDFYNQITGY